MKIGFFGTPDIAAYCLEKLIGRYEVAFVVTCEDKPQGRCLHVCSSPVRDVADAHHIEVFQPCSLKTEDVSPLLEKFNADIFVVVAYGQIIPKKIFAMPRLGSINLHPSLLPKYRGAAPVQWAIIHKERTSGITVQRIDERLDAGDIVLQESFDISIDDTTGAVYPRILPQGVSLLYRAIDGLNDGSIVPVKQNEADAIYCGKINREKSRIHWSVSALNIHNLVRALNPKPVAWCEFRGKHTKIHKTKLFTEAIDQELADGELLRYQKKRLLAGSGDGVLEILQLQPENKKLMTAVEFINGARLEPGEFFT
jgi:methionyl-tRNA formyltransferase